jgi:hypothetical protein
MPTTPTMQLRVIGFRDHVLQENIAQIAAAANKTIKEVQVTTFKGILRDALLYTPPSNFRATGLAAKAAGEASISRDLKAMGFRPKEIKGFRTVTQVFGHPISPVKVATKENPAYADPDAYHHAYLAGGAEKKLFFARRSKFVSMKNRLFKEVGSLASGWAIGALQLGVPVPAWILRHVDLNRGTSVDIIETANRVTMKVTNRFPDKAGYEATETRRRIRYLKEYAIGRLKRQLPYLLKWSVRQAKRN